MAFKDLFKTKAERKAYAKGRKDQYNKEHPLYKWGVETTTFRFNKDGSLDSKSSRVLPGSKFFTKKDAKGALERAIRNEEYHEKRILKAVKNKNVNIYDSDDCQYNKFRLVKISERKR